MINNYVGLTYASAALALVHSFIPFHFVSEVPLHGIQKPREHLGL